jgi:hypothetical protein
MDDLVTKTWRYGGLAVLLCVWSACRAGTDERRGIVSTAAMVGTATVVLECAQLLLPPRIPAITDVLLATLATAGGVTAYRIAAAYFLDERRTWGRSGQPVIFNVEFGPSEPAPAERVPPPAARPGSPSRAE